LAYKIQMQLLAAN